MNVAELNALNDAVGGLSNTLLASRRLNQEGRESTAKLGLERELMGQRRGESADKLALEREMMGLRRDDMADQRANRKTALESQTAHEQRLEAISKEGNETKRNQMYLEFLGQLNKTGQLTDEGLGKMEEAFNKQFGASGLGVKLFRKPPEEPGITYDEDPVSHHRFARHGKTVLNSGQNPNSGIGTMTEEEDPSGGPPKRTFRRTLQLTPGAPEPDSAMGGASAARSTGDPVKDARLAEVEKQIKMHAEALAKGDESTGLGNFIPGNQNRREAVAALQAEQQKLRGANDQGGATALPGGAAPAMSKVTTQEQFDALPSGAKYIGKDGRTYQKP